MAVNTRIHYQGKVFNVTSDQQLSEEQLQLGLEQLTGSGKPKKALKPEDGDAGGNGGLLDFIAEKEGTRDNYNAYYSNGRNSETDFTTMTLNDVLAWQDNFVNGGSPSSAVGRYQIIRKTLRGLMSEMALTGDELFDAKMQDKMALTLLERRGLTRYKKGQMPAETFANNLAMEWASLPVVSGPKRGLSYYAGDGLNRAHSNVDRFLTVVGQV